MRGFYRILILLACCWMTSVSVSQAQCKLFTKKNCIPLLEPYISNGQFNGATLFEGESASVIQTFYSGQDYRLLVCASTILEGAYFEVKDLNGKLLFTAKDKANEPYWDFNVASTQQLSIDVYIPETSVREDLKKSGCVSIMVGFK